MRLLFIITSFGLLLGSCSYRASVNTDLSTGLTVQGSGLSCESVYLTSQNTKLSRNEFIYGEVITVHFDKVEGLTEQNGKVHPKMSMIVLSQSGDTLLFYPDLFKGQEASLEPHDLMLNSELIVARPILSGGTYRMIIHISDTKGKGTLHAEMPFRVKSSPHLTHKQTALRYDEIYLFDSQTNTAVTTDHFPRNHKLLLFYEGLKGFKVQDSTCHVGLSLHIIDKNGNVILNEPDLVADTPIASNLMESQFYASFTTGTNAISNPIQIKAVLWDKEGSARIETTGSFTLNK